jgi:hypothetical protein
MTNFLAESYPLLFKILRNWSSQPERPPLLLNGLAESDFTSIIDSIVELFFEKPVVAGHPDVLILEKDPKKSGIDVEITRDFIGQLALSCFEFPHKLGLIPAASLLNPASQNALLKTLEEPLPNRYLIMGTVSKNRLLPTILSRSTVVNLPKSVLPVDQVLLDDYPQWVESDLPQRLVMGEQWSGGNPENIKQFFEFAVENIEHRLAESLKQRDIKKSRQLSTQLKRALDYSEQLQRTSGANPKLLFESFLLNLS